jgi:hypothetical protein
MKKLLVALAAVLITAATSYGQGSVVFSTAVGPSGARTVDAPVFRPNSTIGAGAGYTAQLFLSQNGTLTPLTPATVFRTDVPAAAAYVVAPAQAVTVPGFAPGSTAPIVFRAWETGAASYDAAIVRGESEVANIVLGGGTLPPTNLVGLKGFTMVPEPSTIALGVIGGLALLLRRRK